MRSRRDTNNTDTPLKLYEIYDNHRNAVLWFLEELDAKNYEGYLEKYSGASSERSHFIAVCGFFELSGVLESYGLIDQNLYFDIFNPTPFWDKAKPIVEGIRTKRPHIYENFDEKKRLELKRLGQKLSVPSLKED